MMDNITLFYELLYAETEDAVEAILINAGYLNDDESTWKSLGDIKNNWGGVASQQSDATGAEVEKITNAIDAVLTGQCYINGIDPKGPDAPKTMPEAVEQFFGVWEGRISSLTSQDQQKLADNIHLIAVDSRQNPNYLLVDRGEGQTPSSFPTTFLSIMHENKTSIPFVQGKFNFGGLGVLPFCGDKNYELIASRRQPGCPVKPDDHTADLWGFTLVRRMFPSGNRLVSSYVYLAPGGEIPAFRADAIKVLPGQSKVNQPPPPYAVDLPYGTCIKLYNYRWKAKSLITTEGRYELERFLPAPALPFRVTETRDYKANYYSASVIGGWNSAISEGDDGKSKKLEEGFPAFGELVLDNIGKLPYQIAVFKEGTEKRHVPRGVRFVLNGQVHGGLPSDFVTRRLKFDYLSDARGPLLVLVDCTNMDARVRENFVMASRERVRHNETYDAIEEALIETLRLHPGLQAINQLRMQKEREKYLNEDAPVDALQSLLSTDPTFANIFGGGDRLVTSTGPGTPPPFIGRRFPTFFRLPKEGLVKGCPVNRTCRVEFETDAMNDYFRRDNDPGEITIEPPNLIEHSHLWNGRFEARFRVPWDAQPGDSIQVTVAVTDVTKVIPFVSTFTLRAEPEAIDELHPGGHAQPRTPTPNGKHTGVAVAIPKPREVHKEEWKDFDPEFNKYESIRLKNDGQGGYVYLVNVDNAYLLTELARAKAEDRPLIKFRFIWGLVLSAVGMLRHSERLATVTAGSRDNEDDEDDEEVEVDNLKMISRYCSGLAQVIVPIIRTLNRGPVA